MDLAGEQMEVRASRVVQQFCRLDHIIVVHLIVSMLTAIEVRATFTNPSAPAFALVVPRQIKAESTLRRNVRD